MFLKQSTAATILVGPVLDSTGAAYTSMAITDFNITKNGSTAAMASAATATHSHEGHYLIALTTGNTDTLGTLVISCNKSTYAMSKTERCVLSSAMYDWLYGTGTPITSGTGTAQLSVSSGAVILQVGTGTGQVSLSSGAVTVGSISNGAITAASIAADAITDAKVASDVTIASVTGSVGSVAGNVSGNVAGSVGSVATGVTLADGAHAGTSATLTLKSITVSNSTGNAVTLSSTGSNGHGMYVTGNGTGDGAHWIGGATGHGMNAQGGSTSGDGIHCAAAGIGDGFEAAGAGGGVDIRGAITGSITGSITGNLSGNVGGNVSGSVQSVVDGITLTGTITTLDTLFSQLSSTHGSGSWATATGFAVAGDAMALTSGERTTLAASIWGALSSGLTTAGSIGKRLVDYITGDIFARLGAPSGASISADIAAIQADTDNIQTRLPAALVGGKMDSNASVSLSSQDTTDIATETAAAVLADIEAAIPAPVYTPTANQDSTRVTASTIECYYGETGWTIGPIACTSTDGSAVDLTAFDTLRFTVEDQYKTDLHVTTTVTVSGTSHNQWSVTGSSNFTGTAPAKLFWSLRGIGTGLNTRLGSGDLIVIYAADQDS